MDRSTARLRFPLFEILGLIFALGFGLAALRTGGALASLVLLAGMALCFAAAIAALLGRDRVRTFSIGFLIAAGGYGATFYFVGENELHPYSGRLPTSQLFRPLRKAMTTVTYELRSTGQVVSEERVRKAFPADRNNIETVETPGPEEFLSVAHLLVGLLLGYAGGKFALAVRKHPSPIESASSGPHDQLV